RRTYPVIGRRASRFSRSFRYVISARAAQGCDVRLGFVQEEATHQHRLLQLAFADIRLVEEVLHDLERDAGLVPFQERDVGMRVGGGAEKKAFQLDEGVGGKGREVTYFVELVEEPQLARFAQIRKDCLQGAAAHRGEGVEGAAREACQRLLEEQLHILGKIREGEFLAGALDLGELGRQLDAAGRVHAHGEAQEYGRVAGVAAVDDAYLRGTVGLQLLET